MASVRIETTAFRDPRFSILGSRIGTSEFDALGRMATIWSYCTQKGTYYLTPKMIDALAKFDNFHTLLTSEDVNLAEETEKGFRIKGTRGRIEWIQSLRKNSRKGGLAASAKRHPKRKPASDPKPYPESSALTLALSPAPSLVPVIKNKTNTICSELEKNSSSRAVPEFASLEKIFEERKVRQETQKCWIDAFPDVNWIVQEIRKALAWEASNPKRRKKDFPRFITNWMLKAWDQRRNLGPPGTRDQAHGFQDLSEAAKKQIEALRNMRGVA